MKKLLVFILIIMFPIITLAYPKGDVNGNNKVDSSDYILVRKHILKQGTLTGDKLTRADVNGDGKVTSADYITIRKTIINGGSVKVSIVATKEECMVKLTAKVEGSINLATNPYSWDGQKTWTSSSTLDATKKKAYRLYVKDKNGNVYFSDKYTVDDLNVPANLKKGIISSKEFNLTKGVGSNITYEIARKNTENFNKALQCANNDGITSLKVENGKYYFGRVSGDNYIQINFSNLTLDLNSSEFHVYPNNNTGYRLILVGNNLPLEETNEIYNVTVKNGTLIGDRYNHRCTVGTWTCNTGGYKCLEQESRQSHEFGHGIAVTANDARIERIHISDMMGDGIYVYNNFKNKKTNYKVFLYKNVIENVRRNGISVIYGKNITIQSNTIRYINGTAPAAGIDVERNETNQYYENVKIDSNVIYGNAGRHSITICPGIKGTLEITNNKLGDQITYSTRPGPIELDRIVVKNNTISAPGGVKTCVCNVNKPMDFDNDKCNKCTKDYCGSEKVVNGLLKKK